MIASTEDLWSVRPIWAAAGVVVMFTKRHYILRLHQGPDVRAILKLFAS